MIDKKKLQNMQNNSANNNPQTTTDPNYTLEINNDEIEELVAKYSKESTSDNLNMLMNKMHVARILVPANVNKQGQPVPFIIQNKDGDNYMPIYTSKKHIPEEPKAPAILNIPFLGVNQMALREEVNSSGIVINPFTDNLVFKKPLLEKVAEVEKARQEAPKVKTIQLTEAQYTLVERRQFERVNLPKKLFTEKEEFVSKLIDRKEEFIDELFEDSYQQKRMYPYLPEDFSIMVLGISDTLQLIRIDMPSRDMEIGSCVRIYMAWESDKAEAHYYTIEIADQTAARNIAEINSELEHVEHGEAPVEGAELQAILDMI